MSTLARKEGVYLKKLAGKINAGRLPDVNADALIEHEDGRQETRVVTLWEKLPPWWNRVEQDARQAWVSAYFERQLKLPATSKLIKVIFGRVSNGKDSISN